MLEQIENQLEAYYKIEDTISPDFLAEKRAGFLKRRREEQRKLTQERQEQEKRRKTEQAMARARMPIKRRTGRPVIQRARLIKRERNENERLMLLRREQQRIDYLLFAPPSPDD
jgi:hypothetical protein